MAAVIGAISALLWNLGHWLLQLPVRLHLTSDTPPPGVPTEDGAAMKITPEGSATAAQATRYLRQYLDGVWTLAWRPLRVVAIPRHTFASVYLSIEGNDRKTLGWTFWGWFLPAERVALIVPHEVMTFDTVYLMDDVPRTRADLRFQALHEYGHRVWDQVLRIDPTFDRQWATAWNVEGDDKDYTEGFADEFARFRIRRGLPGGLRAALLLQAEALLLRYAMETRAAAA